MGAPFADPFALPLGLPLAGLFDAGFPSFIDNFERADGAAGNGWGSQVTIVNGKAVITPTLGSELLTDPGLENWSSSTNLTSYNESVSGTSTVNQETVDVHGGSSAARLAIDASNNGASFNQVVTMASAEWLVIQGWIKTSVVGRSARMDLGAAVGPATTLTATYTRYRQGRLSAAANPALVFGRSTAGSSNLYYDDLSAKLPTVATLFGGRPALSFPPRVVKARWTRATGAPCGAAIIADADNYLYAYDNGAGTMLLRKVIAGIGTQVSSASFTYGADGETALLYDPVGLTAAVQYNGASVISPSSVTNTVLQTAMIADLFSLSDDNQCSSFEASAA